MSIVLYDISALPRLFDILQGSYNMPSTFDCCPTRITQAKEMPNECPDPITR